MTEGVIGMVKKRQIVRVCCLYVSNIFVSMLIVLHAC